MKIHLREIPPEGKHVEDELAPVSVELPPDLEFLDPLRVEVDLYRSGTQVDARSRVATRLRLACHRCTEEFVYAVEAAIRTIFQPRPERQPELAELGEAELGLAFYEDERLDLSQSFRDAVLLDLPLQQLCRPDCAGLCPRCGANRNRQRCQCVGAEEAPSNPFAEFFDRQGKAGE